MSDPVTNVEIEDVLSSIRRLVSDEDRSAPKAQEQSDAPVSEPERFVLTPALRVADVDPVEPEQEVAETEAEIAAVEPEDDSVEVLENAVKGTVVEVSDEPFELKAVEPEENQAPDLDAEAVAEVDPAHSEPVVEEPSIDAAEDETIAQAEPISADKWEDVEPAADRSELEAKIAALEAAVGNREDEWEPDGSEEIATTDGVWPDHGPTPVVAPVAKPIREQDSSDAVQENAAPEVAQQAYDAADQSLDDDAADELEAIFGEESVIDEDMLREMVADIVRQELQGTLGERITRNVRKLVRREIHRVLASQEFD